MDTKIVKKKSKLKFVLIIITSAVAISIFGWYFLNQKKTYNVKSEDITIDEVTNGKFEDMLIPNSAIEKKEYFSILISNCVAVEKNKR